MLSEKQHLTYAKPQPLDEGVEVNYPLPSSFIMGIIGPPGSGKSWIISELLRQDGMYRKKFDAVFFIAPTVIHGLEMHLGENWCQFMNQSWIEDILRVIGNKIAEYRKTWTGEEGQTFPKFNILFIFDDVLQYFSLGKPDVFLSQLFNNRRNICNGAILSFIVTGQKIKGFYPLWLRVITTDWIFFKMLNKEIDTIMDELLDTSNKMKRLSRRMIFDLYFKDKFDFLFLSKNGEVFINFHKLII